MRRLGVILLLASAIAGSRGAAAQNAGPDAAQPFDTASYPAGVQAVLQAAGKTCKEAGGGGVKFAPDTVRAVNLTGGEHSDYIVDLRDAACQDRENAFCGSGGCEIDIVVALPGGRMRTVFSQAVRDYEVLPGSGARSIRFTMQGAYCGSHGNPSCSKIHLITIRPFAFKMPQ